MKLVTEGKYRVNQLGYNIKTGEYVYFHKGQEIWREKGDRELFDYFNEVRGGCTYFDDKKVENNPIWKKYVESCDAFERSER